MNRKSLKYSHFTQIVLMLLFVLSDLFIFHSYILAQEKDSVWKDMITREQTAIRDQQFEFEKFIAKQPEEAEKAQEKYMEFNRELRRLLLAHGITVNTPVECRDTLQKLDALKENVYCDINPINEQIKLLDLFEEETQVRKEEYSKLAEDKSLSGSARIIREYIEDLNKLSTTTIAVKQLLAALPYTEDFLFRLEQRRSSVEKELGVLWKTYFFEPIPKHFFTSSAWEMAYFAGKVWFKLAPLFGLTPSEEQKSSFKDFVFKITSSWLLASLACFFFLKRFGKKLPDSSHPVRHYFPCCVWTTLGLSVIIYTITSEHFQFGSYQSFGDIFISGGAVSLAWNLRRTSLAETNHPPHNILWPLWVIFVTGIIVQILRVPIVTITPVFTVMFLLFSIYYYFLKKHITLDPERKLSIFTAALLVILAVIALLGWGSLSMLISALWFMIVLNIELGSGLSSHFWKITHSGRHKSTVLILLTNMVLPLIFIGLLTLMIVWATIYMGGMPLLHNIVQSEIDWGMIKFRIITVLTLVALFFLSRSLIALFSTSINFLRMRWENIEEGVIKSLQTLSSYMIWSCYVIASLNFLGVGINNLTFIAGGLSVGVGFALQDLIKNFVGGLMLLFGRSVHPGDHIQIDDVHGRVTRIDIRSTVVQTNEDSTIFLPNADLILKKIVNWTHKDPRGRVEVVVGVAYGSDTALTKYLLMQCALSNPDVLAEPPPYVLFNDFGDNALIFHLRFWIMNVVLSKDMVRSEIRYEIERVFKEHGIELAYPQLDIHIRSVEGLKQLFKKTADPLTNMEPWFRSKP